MKRTLGRVVPAMLALFCLCVAYAAPLGVALIERSMAGGCCPKGKAAHCCKRTSSPSWVDSGSGCGGHCPGSFTSTRAIPAVIPSAQAQIFALAAAQPSIGEDPSAIRSSSYIAFLYQRPPPVC